MRNNKSTLIQFRLPNNEADRVKDLADRQRVSLTRLLIEAVHLILYGDLSRLPERNTAESSTMEDDNDNN